MTSLDPVRTLLNARGCPPGIVEAGLAGLVSLWTDVVGAVEGGYELTLDDYQNDMDLRGLVADALAVAPPYEADAVRDRLTNADARLLAHTMPCPCLWGEDIAAEEGLDPTHDWWYFRRPTRPGEALAQDLATWGLA